MPWISGNMEQQHQVKEEHADSTTASLAANDQPTDLRCPKGKTEAHDSTKENVDDPEAEVALNVDNDEKEEKEIIEIRHNGIEKSVTPLSAESPSSSSSASKRKSYNPRKVGDTPEIRQADASDDAPAATESAGQEDNQPEGKDEVEDGPQYSALQSQLNSMPNLKINNDMFETHKRFYSNLLEQQKKMMTTGEDRNRPAQQNSQQNIGQLAQSLKTEIVQNVSISIDKVLKEWAVAEAMQQLQTLEANRQMQNQLQQQQQFPPVFSVSNPLASFGLPGAPPSSIFPNPFSAPVFNPLAVFNNLRRPPPEGEPKRKKEKPAEGITKQDDTTSIASESPSRSARESPKLSETPLSQYFPPTMVGHPMYGSGFCKDGSPPNSDDMSDFGDCTGGVSSTLTPMHLRKAKLMFFYTRYPNSTLLKSYFPDIRFNKNNTAQLVKWFSNFREFFYIQMEKYARQALAEGIKRREDIHVTLESDIFKALNTHYNRNNHIQPPEKLVHVVEESLREFFDAIRLGRDSEPSWKKSIYKVINRLDDHIPEYFKDPNFLERLET
ncbi:hypothetical protein WR25_24969 isoform A [Diploscapter pachys]|uniref:Prospero domain-containing protein n=1 Tax=Diploscapter pachys TaxID=2018661 RepID=A0A2A2LHA7_9BILA|nr:hypothetical protein WR25_24969 isoform A [Diploscapter pachys]